MLGRTGNYKYIFVVVEDLYNNKFDQKPHWGK